MFSDLPPKRPLPGDKGFPDCGAGYFDAQGLGAKLDYCRGVGGGGCRNAPSFWSCALAGEIPQYSGEGMFLEPGIHHCCISYQNKKK